MQKDLRVLITGAASGLGKALALAYAEKGGRIALVDVNEARGRETLAAVQTLGAQGFFHQADVRSSDCFEQLLAEVTQRWGGLDVLINNAGVAAHGAIDEAPIVDWQWILDINLMAVVRACRTFVPLFKAQGHGTIINIASMAGLLHSADMGSYSVSKAGVVALSETLYAELRMLGIKVSVVCPGFFQTNLIESLRSPDPAAESLVKKLLTLSRIDADDIAAIIVRKAAAGTFMILPHAIYRPLWLLKRWFPSLYLFILIRLAGSIKKQRAPAQKILA